MLWIIILMFVLTPFNFAKNKIPEVFEMKIYGDCYFYHMPTQEICMKHFVKFKQAARNEFFTSPSKTIIGRLVECENIFGQVIKFYIYMTPEDIKLCNQKPEFEINIGTGKK